MPGLKIEMQIFEGNLPPQYRIRYVNVSDDVASFWLGVGRLEINQTGLAQPEHQPIPSHDSDSKPNEILDLAQSTRITEDNRRKVLGWPISTRPGLSAEDEPELEAMRVLAEKAMAPGRAMGWEMALERVERSGRTNYFVVIARLWGTTEQKWMCAPSEEDVYTLKEASPHFSGKPTWEILAREDDL